MLRYIRILPFLALLCLLSCGSKHEEQYLAFDTVVPVIIDTEKMGTLNAMPFDDKAIDLPGLLDVKVLGDYLMFATKDPAGYIKIYDKEGRRSMGDFLKQGNGPGELLSPVFFSSIYFDGDDAVVNNSNSGIVDWNIRSSCEEGMTVASTRINSSIKTPTFVSSILPIEDNALLCAEISVPPVGYKRYLYKNGEKNVLPSQEKLNNVRATKEDGSSFNMFFGFAVYNKSRKLVVEASAILNTIQMYSLDGRIEKTICIGENPDNVLAIERLSYGKQPASFGSLRSYDSGFGILYFNTNQKDIQTARSKKPSLLFFDWDGNLLFNYTFPVWVSTFDIDWDDKVIYAVDNNEEKIYKFTMPE